MHIFDIETGADVPRAMALLPEFDENDVAVGNLKDPLKIAAKIGNRRENHEKTWLERAALLPETGMVLAIGMLLYPDTDPTIIHVNQSSEENMLESWWDLFRMTREQNDPPWAGFNCDKFDLPFLILRSRILGIRVPRNLRYGRYFNPDYFCDLLNEWLLGRPSRAVPHSLDHVARSLGCGGKNGDGAQFSALYTSDPDAALAYLRNDIHMTAGVASKLGLMEYTQLCAQAPRIAA
jgi:hypothetical protein